MIHVDIMPGLEDWSPWFPYGHGSLENVAMCIFNPGGWIGKDGDDVSFFGPLAGIVGHLTDYLSVALRDEAVLADQKKRVWRPDGRKQQACDVSAPHPSIGAPRNTTASSFVGLLCCLSWQSPIGRDAPPLLVQPLLSRFLFLLFIIIYPSFL